MSDKAAVNPETGASEVRLLGAGDAHEQLYRMIFGASIVQMLRSLALYSFADHLDGGPAAPEAIAEAEGLSLDATRRLMRACVAFGLMTAEPGGRYGSTPLLAPLKKDDPMGLRYLAICQGGKACWGPWGLMDQALKTGEPQAKASLGTSVWEYLSSPENVIEREAVGKLMKGVLSGADKAAAERLDTRGLGVAADIGGASGSLLRALMNANPALRGVLLDLPLMAEDARQVEENIALGERLTIAGGDFFKAVPQADLYLMRTILHDWADEQCLVLLRQCRQSARAGARLAVIEMLLGEGPGVPFAAQIDLTMLVQLGGRERTLDEYRALLAQAGFEVRSAAPLAPPFSLIEAVAV